ncbi:hypothetical protein vBValSX1_157 [Vibrio phage vB_ValS_X1]|uniref:Uncharacterized protein n=1 Tax=Vibrio phage vB_ValS_X1 TaxID=2736341 RepID=A0A6M9Z6D6_9CAUD|nr:hypothetical protein vBValSX1_157 [Vibrio phage vB_ValS_X1]
MATLLFSLEEYKEYAAIASPTQDAKIEQLMPAVASAIQTYLGYEFEEAPVADNNGTFPFVTDVLVGATETQVTSPHQQEYMLQDVDVVVTEVKLRRTGAPETENKVLGADDWFVDSRLGKLTVFPTLDKSYIMTVTYDVDLIQASADIKLAGFMLLDYWIDRKNFNKTVVSQGQSTTKVRLNNMPKHIENILNMYRKA